MTDTVTSVGAAPGLGYGPPVATRTFVRIADGAATTNSGAIAEEVPVAFVYGARSHVVMMASPADLEDLAFGFTLTEEIVAARSDIGAIAIERHSRGIELRIEIPAAAAARLLDRGRALTGRTGCGLCGVEAIDDAVRTPRVVSSPLTLSTDALWRAGAALDAQQLLNRDTRAVHAAAWATPDGTLHVVREDVGRHNALDKVIGALARTNTDASTGFVIVTSRASFELVQKTATANIPILAAVSRPTGLAIRLAESANIALVGLLRGQSANIYAHAERLTPAQ